MTKPRNYSQEAASQDVVVRQTLAIDEATPPEVLYFLADDKSEVVRESVAANEATPLQVMPKLVHDRSPSVRAAVARKIARVLPKLEGNILESNVMDMLGELAKDQADVVREQVAVTLQDTAYLPPPLALALARDAARHVAAPVLRYCLSLSDDDLVGLIKTSLLPSSYRPWVPVEVAHRRYLKAPVVEAVWESGNMEAAQVMLENLKADASPALLDEVTDVASAEVQLQAPLVRRPELSAPQLARLAEFVDGSLLEVLSARAAVDRGTMSDVSQIVRRRLDFAAWRQKAPSEIQRARSLFAKGELDYQAISDAVACGERDFVAVALALLAHIDPAFAFKILDHKSPKGITALCFKAGIPMRTCRQIQLRIARVPVVKALYARDGVDYPLTLDEIKWQLEFYGVIEG